MKGRQGILGRLTAVVFGAGFLLTVPAGALWALSPLGVRLSEYGFKTPNVFWKLFPSVPILLVLAILFVYLYHVKSRSFFQTVGVASVVVGGVLTVLGDIGLYHLRLDNIFIMSAPAWHSFRLGLVLVTAGTLLFAGASVRNRSLPVWGTFPLGLTAIAGLVAVLHDYGQVGAAMWISFGVGWVWLGLVLAVQSIVVRVGEKRRGDPASETTDTGLSTAKRG